MDTINLKSKLQVVLMEVYLKGQISDGYWSNSKPFNHWKQPCNAKVAENRNNFGINFIPTKTYNFAMPELVHVIQDDLVRVMRAVEKYPNLDVELYSIFFTGKWFWETESGLPHDFRNKFIEATGITSYDVLESLFSSDIKSHEIKVLKSELKEITSAFKCVTI